jgi:hypothetical protein
MQQPIYKNPFLTWAELLRELRNRFLAEAGLIDGGVLRPRIGQFVGGLAQLVNDCEMVRQDLDDLQRNDLEAFEAFQRALEKP